MQSEQLLADRPPELADRAELTDTPFNSQVEFQCGPAALATLLQHNGLAIQPADLVPEVYLPQREGSLQLELVSSTRRHDLLPYTIDENMQALLTEIQAGNPVLVLQNLGLKWIPRWHYAVVIGFDLEKDQIYLRSGEQRRHVNSFSVFERTWRRAGYWGMLVMPLDKLPASASAFGYLSTAAAFEKLGRLQQARTAYYTALQKWPDDRHLLMAAGNIGYQLSDHEEAERHYGSVIDRWPEYAPALNNMAQLKYDQGRYDEAETLVQRAIDHGGRFRDQYLETLQNIVNARGKQLPGQQGVRNQPLPDRTDTPCCSNQSP